MGKRTRNYYKHNGETIKITMIGDNIISVYTTFNGKGWYKMDHYLRSD